jgi:hypothetical protein
MACHHFEQTAPNANFCFNLAKLSSVALSAREMMLISNLAGKWLVGSSQSGLAMEMGGYCNMMVNVTAEEGYCYQCLIDKATLIEAGVDLLLCLISILTCVLKSD